MFLICRYRLQVYTTLDVRISHRIKLTVHVIHPDLWSLVFHCLFVVEFNKDLFKLLIIMWILFPVNSFNTAIKHARKALLCLGQKWSYLFLVVGGAALFAEFDLSLIVCLNNVELRRCICVTFWHHLLIDEVIFFYLNFTICSVFEHTLIFNLLVIHYRWCRKLGCFLSCTKPLDVVSWWPYNFCALGIIFIIAANHLSAKRNLILLDCFWIIKLIIPRLRLASKYFTRSIVLAFLDKWRSWAILLWCMGLLWNLWLLLLFHARSHALFLHLLLSSLLLLHLEDQRVLLTKLVLKRCQVFLIHGIHLWCLLLLLHLLHRRLDHWGRMII